MTDLLLGPPVILISSPLQGHEGHHHHLDLAGLGGAQLASSWQPHHHFRSVNAAEAREGIISAAAASAPSPAVAVHRRPISERSQDYWGMNLGKMPNHENATNVPGSPGEPSLTPGAVI